ncbi:G-protein-coupled receptor family 3 protein [Heterostelium album PN500]|uniref:G-protein-coupled receptor family 3 protein n=1 Tax=Heterostelium pallidum (strain ATCC 26659 / Pp 5 / PN500) TaxID=670386 RepID=D3BI86_HETP5|nr:G-protein-coupled receptor family 3 protein [Heterostelium album PN500]EFA78986.1 G-protein-coupled receptor family 3 protein [Heterostelium album PN500]|eukprot:XP_020431110.1 G-protein-coupled receptor family 3 protein [Heterostelium album PN500]
MLKYILLFLTTFLVSRVISANVDNSYKIAIICNGELGDFGFNYMINDAMVKTQRAMNTTNIHIFEDIKPEIFNQTIDSLVEKGYNGIVTTSVEMTTPTRQYAQRYPQIKWLTRGSLTNTTNLAFFTYNIGVCQYIIGYFAGLVSNTSMIGYVAPGAPLVNNYNANALFVGARMANNNSVVHTYNTGTWLDQDISRGAANYLLDLGVDLISNNQDDMSVEVEAIKRGKLGLGTNGFPQENVYGEHIGMSFITDWSHVFINFTNWVRNETKNSYKDYGDFDNNFLKLGKFSFVVSDDVKTKVENEVARLITIPRAKHPYLCNEYNKAIFPNLTGNCITNGQFFGLDAPYEGMVYHGFYKVPLVNIGVSKPVLMGITITAGVLIFFSLILLAAVYYFRNSHSIRSASPVFTGTIIVGAIFTYVGAIIYVMPNNDATCNARYYLLAIGYALMVGCMVVKNFRIWLIFDNPELKRIKITNAQLAPWVGGLIAIMIVLLACITAESIGNLRANPSFVEEYLGKYEYTDICDLQSNGQYPLYILLGVFAILLIVGVFVSWKIRIVDMEEFNESKPIAHTLYVAMLSIFIVIPLMVSPQTQNSESTIICTAAIFITTISMLLLFVPKFIRLFRHGENSSSQNKSSIAASRSSKNSSKVQSEQFDDEESIEGPEPTESRMPEGPIHAQFDSDDDEMPVGDTNSTMTSDINTESPKNQ